MIVSQCLSCGKKVEIFHTALQEQQASFQKKQLFGPTDMNCVQPDFVSKVVSQPFLMASKHYAICTW